MAYSTTFPLTENPISEGGVWLQHNTNRAKVLTTGGNAFGTGTNNDGYAYLAGAGDSVIETTVFRDAALADGDTNSYEVEHLHRLTDTAGTTACYELDFAFSGGDPIIVLWSGATSFVVLSGLIKDANFWPDGAGGQLRNGYKIKSETVLLPSPRINFYADSGSGYVLYGHYIFGADAVNDAVPLATGDPAIAFFTTLGSSNLFGMSDATITSLSSPVIVVPTTSRAGRGPGQGPRLRRMAPQQFPTPAPADTVTPTPTATPFHIGGGTSGKGVPQRRRIPQQFPDTIPFVQDGSATQTPFRIGRGGGIGTPTRRMFPQRYADTVASAAAITGKIGAYTWAGIAAPISVIIAATVGTYTWSGKTSRLSTEILGKVGAYTWAGKTSSISTSIRSTTGAYTWAGKTSSIAASIISRVGAYSWSGVAANLSGVAVVQEGVGAYRWAGVSSVLANLAPAVSAGGGASGAKRYRQPAWWGDEKKRKLLKKVEAVQLQIEKKREQIDLAPDLFRIQRLIEQIADLQKRMMKLLEQIDELNKLAGDEEAMLIYTIYRSLH